MTLEEFRYDLVFCSGHGGAKVRMPKIRTGPRNFKKGGCKSRPKELYLPVAAHEATLVRPEIR